NGSASYDGFYLLAYGSFAAAGGGAGAIDGFAISRAFARLMPPGARVEVGPSHVFDAGAKLAAGGSIDLQGTTPLNLDFATGEDVCDFSLRCAAVDATGKATGADVESGVILRAGAARAEGTPRCP